MRIKNIRDQSPSPIPESILKKIIIQLGLVLLSSLLFTASFPNPVIVRGLPFLAWFSLIPVLIVIKNNSLPVCLGWAVIYGSSSYALFNYWLGTFHPLAGMFVYSLYSFYMVIVFALFKLADKLYVKKGYIIQWIIWIAYEYLRTKGFLGYSYGITGYSQWQFLSLIQIANITGVWGVSALVAFPSFWLANLFNSNLNEKKKIKTSNNESSPLSPVSCPLEKVPILIWAVFFILTLIYGWAENKDFSDYPHAKIALIQNNTDPWAPSRATSAYLRRDLYKKDLNTLIRLSDEALEQAPDTQLVVWPETAFIPRIHWHSTYREDQDSYLIVRELLDYLSKNDVPFLIGNDDGRMDRAKNPNAEERHRIDYNAAILFEKGIIANIYRKQHLVPFTEHFPYKKQLPFIYKALEKVDTFFWEKGTDKTVFTIAQTQLESGPYSSAFSFSAPICFEDTFGYLSRDFVLNGADILVNLTNDAWADSLSSQY